MKLLTGQDPIAKSFRCHICTYNSALAMTSVGRHLDNSVNDGHGLYTFKLHGELTWGVIIDIIYFSYPARNGHSLRVA